MRDDAMRKITARPFEAAAKLSDFGLAIVNSSRASVILLDLTGRLLEVNDPVLALLGASRPQQLVGRHWTELWPATMRATVEASIDEARRGIGNAFTAQSPTPKGERRWWEVTVTPLRGEDGDVRYLLSTSYDVTTLKAREAELEDSLRRKTRSLMALERNMSVTAKRLARAEARSTRADKLEIFGKFVGGVVHDFANIFAAVHGAARIIRRRLTEPTILGILEQVEAAVDRGSRLSRQLLDFAHHQSADAEAFSPSALLDQEAHLLRHVFSSGHTLSVEAARDVWPIYAPKDRFLSVVFNLAANARDALGARGTVRLSLSNCPSNARPMGLDQGDYVRMEVADTGSGMSPETLKRAGEPFFTTKGEGRGSGLGLASAYELAELCGGKVLIDSKLGEGTSVTVYFRRSPVAGEVISSPDGEIDPNLHGGAHVLVIDDNEPAREHLSQLLRGLNYLVTDASSAEIAEMKAASSQLIDLVVTDLNLTDGLGTDVVRRLRQKLPDLPAIYMTGGSGVRPEEGAETLHKPISETKLSRAILRQLRRLPGEELSADVRARSEKIGSKIVSQDLKRTFAAWRGHVERFNRIPMIEDSGPWNQSPPPMSYLLSVAKGPRPTFRFERVDALLDERLGRPLTGALVSAADEVVLGGIRRGFARSLGGAATYDYARFALPEGTVRLFERILLPISDKDGSVSHLFGAVAFSERKSEGPT